MARKGTLELRAFIKQHGKLDKDIKRFLRKRMREAAQKPLAQAKRNASWSSRIPRATRLSISLSKRRTGITLRTKRNIAPHGRPYEHKGQQGRFRHPVFPDPKKDRRQWKWVYQTARPFLWPAAKPWRKNIDKEIGKALDEVRRMHGYK